ncbi:MAG TPA: 1-deoxy-D-xylulose-5-phosphate reductoisomerase, partial [Aestuariivirgaceae bacterium]|nr:1-deoxy-D-xylulose-5-phosphate reductoisomerase [Aestuariivirgaceae bacterium]
EEIGVLVHPQSIVHGLVEYCDGSVVAVLAPPDMRVPIGHCLAWPDRIEGPARLDFSQLSMLSFEAPDTERFPALLLAQTALKAGGSASNILNAANEVAVAAFLDDRLDFLGIPRLVEATIEAASARGLERMSETLEAALEIDHVSRLLAQDLLPEIAAKAS